MVDIVMTDLPAFRCTRASPTTQCRRNVQGFEYWFHTHPDFRKLYKE